MKESYPDENMLCFVQGFGDGEHGFNKNREFNISESSNVSESNLKFKKRGKPVSLHFKEAVAVEFVQDSRIKKSQALVTGKTLKLTSGSRFPEVKRSLSERLAVITDRSGKKPAKEALTIRKTW
ncbi:putative glutaredoxin, grx [Operophtera brumata]|uniref:Putative glutaredoxin, grx n=1 Tax=Operophtera brumata TaxID=104452 RepID=A0A0L7LH15_OPEBR|nr:putative glutaredoxin, grx [Operophtera brumata]